MRHLAIFGYVLDSATINSLHSSLVAAAAGFSVTQPANGTVTVAPDLQSLTYTPNPEFFGEDSFAYSVSGGMGASSSDTATVTVTVTVLAAGDAQLDNITVTSGESIVIDAIANDFIGEGLTASITAVEQPDNGVAVPLDDGQIEYTPNEGFVGTDVFTYSLTNSDGVDATGYVIVTPANLWPTANDDIAVTNYGESVFIDVLANDTDPDSDELWIPPGQLARQATLTEGPLLH